MLKTDSSLHHENEGAATKHTKMGAVLSKIQVVPSWLTSKSSGLIVAAAASGIIFLWKKKLNEVSRKRLGYMKRLLNQFTLCVKFSLLHSPKSIKDIRFIIT